MLKTVIIQIDDILADLSSLPESELPCTNASLVMGSVDALQVEYNLLVDLLHTVGVKMKCDDINPLYGAVAYSSKCYQKLETRQPRTTLISLCSYLDVAVLGS